MNSKIFKRFVLHRSATCLKLETVTSPHSPVRNELHARCDLRGTVRDRRRARTYLESQIPDTRFDRFCECTKTLAARRRSDVRRVAVGVGATAVATITPPTPQTQTASQNGSSPHAARCRPVSDCTRCSAQRPQGLRRDARRGRDIRASIASGAAAPRTATRSRRGR